MCREIGTRKSDQNQNRIDWAMREIINNCIISDITT